MAAAVGLKRLRMARRVRSAGKISRKVGTAPLRSSHRAVRRTSTNKDADLRIDIDLDEAAREAARVRTWLTALRRRHDLSRYEYTRHVRVVPASKTYSHPILTLGTRFTETEDQLLATYLHEQMHWYLYHLGGIDHDPIAPFFDELVRRYPDAPTALPDGARNYDQTYAHLVVCWLEIKVTSAFIGRARAFALAETPYGYRWIYRTVVRDWDALEALFTAHGILPMVPADGLLSAARRKSVSKGPPTPSRPSRRTPRARGGRSAG
jgi:hypothetical protein